MICFDISLFIVAAFLVLTLVVGIYFSRKKTTFREYAVGNKEFSTATLVATVLASTLGGGGLVRSVEQVYSTGLYWITLFLLHTSGFYIVSWLTSRMGPFMQHLSMAETIGSVYGQCARFIVALSNICYSIVVVTGQIGVMSLAITMCIDSVSPKVVTIIATLILIFYSVFGGIRAVIFTDVLQFITFTMIIPLLAWYIFTQTRKPASKVLFILKSQEKFQFSKLFRFDTKLVSLIALCLSNIVSRIEPLNIQRVYMSSNLMQAKRLFLFSTLFDFTIRLFIISVGLFVFIGAPELPMTSIWGYIMDNVPPIFRGIVSISLLAMTMSTADSILNSCSIMFSHDIMGVIRVLKKEKKASDSYQLRLARVTTLIVGLSSMSLAFYCRDLLKILYWTLDLSVPIITAPFILVVFGFRGTSRTALIGMATGVVAILAWNKWVEPSTGINGSFIAMLANGLAMVAAHYFLKQPESAGWVGPDDTFKQIQQENARKHAEQKEAIKNVWTNKATTLAKLRPSDSTLCLTGLYIIATATLGYWFLKQVCLHKAICQVVVGFLFASYGLFTRYKTFFSKAIPAWFIGLGWLMGLVLYFPIDLLWNWWHPMDPIFSVSLSLTHCSIILWVLPLYLGIGVVAATLLVAIYPIATGVYCPLLSSLFPLFLASLLLFTVIICFKVRVGDLTEQNIYLKAQEKIRENQKLKASLYEAAMVSSNRATAPKLRGYGFVLTQVVRKIEESISFLDSNMPLYKQDFQSIINKFYDWVVYFNKKEMAKDHTLLQPTKITLDKLIRKVEVALSQEVADPPRLLIEKTSDPNGGLCSDIVCDVNQVVYVLVQTVLRVGKLEDSNAPVVRIQLHPTVLQFKQTDPVDGSDPICLLFPATALVISQATTPADLLPKAKASYDDVINCTASQERKEAPPSIDLQQQTISNVIGAHYGCLEDASDQKQPTMLLVLPNDVTEILRKITTTLPIDALTLETPVTPKEQADSMMVLMQFHDYVSSATRKSRFCDG